KNDCRWAVSTGSCVRVRLSSTAFTKVQPSPAILLRIITRRDGRDDGGRVTVGLPGAAPWTEIARGGCLPRRDEINPYLLGEDGANCPLIAVGWSIELCQRRSIPPRRSRGSSGPAVSPDPAT